MSSAPPIYMSEPYSTYEMKKDGSLVYEVPSKPISSTKSHVKFAETRDGTNAFIPGEEEVHTILGELDQITFRSG